MKRTAMRLCIVVLSLFLISAAAEKLSLSPDRVSTADQADGNNTAQIILSSDGIGSRQKLYTADEADWTSSDPGVAAAEDGMVSAVSPGTAMIQAYGKSSGELLLSVQVTVRELDTFSLPDSLTVLEAQALFGTDAERILLPESIQSIDPEAFANCARLLVLYIPADALPNRLFIGEQTVIYIDDSGVPFNGYVGHGHVI